MLKRISLHVNMCADNVSCCDNITHAHALLYSSSRQPMANGFSRSLRQHVYPLGVRLRYLELERPQCLFGR